MKLNLLIRPFPASPRSATCAPARPDVSGCLRCPAGDSPDVRCLARGGCSGGSVRPAANSVLRGRGLYRLDRWQRTGGSQVSTGREGSTGPEVEKKKLALLCSARTAAGCSTLRCRRSRAEGASLALLLRKLLLLARNCHQPEIPIQNTRKSRLSTGTDPTLERAILRFNRIRLKYIYTMHDCLLGQIQFANTTNPICGQLAVFNAF
jgi:hypothetical protein